MGRRDKLALTKQTLRVLRGAGWTKTTASRSSRPAAAAVRCVPRRRSNRMLACAGLAATSLALLAACGGSLAPQADEPPASDATTPPADATAPPSAQDAAVARLDAAVDAGADATRDAGQDAPPDAPADGDAGVLDADAPPTCSAGTGPDAGYCSQSGAFCGTPDMCCECGTDPAGDCYLYAWHCWPAPGAGCPASAPTAGDPCSVEGVRCRYCVTAFHGFICRAGVWYEEDYGIRCTTK